MSYHLIKILFGTFAKTYLNFQVVNQEKLSNLSGNGYVVASNHVSYLDGPLIGLAFPDPIYFFARKPLFDPHLMGWFLRTMKAIPVDQAKPEVSTLKHIISLVKDGEKVVIFPEGERTFDGKLKEIGEPGVGLIVEKAGCGVLPVRLFGPEKALPRDSTKLKRCPVTLVIGEPLDLSDLMADKSMGRKLRYEKITERIMESIRKLECP